MVGIKTMFDMKGISVDQEWLLNCIASHEKEENLFNGVYNDWLYSDLKHSGNRCLKPIIERKDISFDCKGAFAVQMQYLFEISK